MHVAWILLSSLLGLDCVHSFGQYQKKINNNFGIKHQHQRRCDMIVNGKFGSRMPSKLSDLIKTVVEAPPPPPKKRTIIKQFLKSNWLIVGQIITMVLAHLNPQFGATGGVLRPEFFISKCAVFTIFFINGIALSISGSPSEMQSATKTNASIQLFNFAVIPLLAYLLVPFFPIPAFRFPSSYCLMSFQ